LNDLGTIRPKQKVTGIFNFIGKIKVLSIETSCGCAGAKWDEKEQRLTISYTGADIPQQIIAQGRDYMNVTQNAKLKTVVNETIKEYILMIKIKVEDVRIFRG